MFYYHDYATFQLWYKIIRMHFYDLITFSIISEWKFVEDDLLAVLLLLAFLHYYYINTTILLIVSE